jgi:uncharacterized tellurite resistance protein B-like protein
MAMIGYNNPERDVSGLSAMFKDFKQKFWDNPYWATVTEPLRSVGRMTVASLDHFIEAAQEAFDDNPYDKKPKLMRLPGELMSTDRDSVAMVVVSAIGMFGGLVAGGAFGGMAAFAGMAGAGTAVQIGAAVIGGIAGVATGIYAGAAVAAGAVALGAATVGLVYGLTAGVASGAIKTYKHHQQMKNAPTVAAATAAVTAATSQQQQTPSVNETVSDIVNSFMTLPKESREALFTELERIGGDPARMPAEKMAHAIERMPDKERLDLIEKLQERLSADFGAVARKQALEEQDDDVEVYRKPINLKRRNPANGQTA